MNSGRGALAVDKMHWEQQSLLAALCGTAFCGGRRAQWHTRYQFGPGERVQIRYFFCFYFYGGGWW